MASPSGRKPTSVRQSPAFCILGGAIARSGLPCPQVGVVSLWRFQHRSPVRGAATDQPGLIGEYDSLYPVA